MKVGCQSGGTYSGTPCCGNSQSGFVLWRFARSSGPPRSSRQYASEKKSTFEVHTAMLEERSWKPVTSAEWRTIVESRCPRDLTSPKPPITKKNKMTILSICNHRALALVRVRATIGTV